MNARGTRYSRNHTSLNPDIDRNKFWNFSWHEIGLYDLPAAIDHILKTTNYQKLSYVGHSQVGFFTESIFYNKAIYQFQGTTTFFVMTSLLPEYDKKLSFAALFNPPSFLKGDLAIPTFVIDLIYNFRIMLGEVARHDIFSLKLCFHSKETEDFCRSLFTLLNGPEIIEKVVHSNKHLS